MEKRKKLTDRAFEDVSTKDFQSLQNKCAFTRGRLLNLRTKALRRGIWFTVLSKTERACIELTIRVVDKVRSRFLAQVLASIIWKLSGSMKSRIVHAMEGKGCSIAWKLSRIAQNWGNVSASRWAKNRGFIQYLAVMYMNMPATFQVVS